MDWPDELELALTNRGDFRQEGRPVHGGALTDFWIVLRAAWHGAHHAFDDMDQQEILAAISRVERGL